MAGGGEVAAGAPQPTCIKVHIHQESALAKLLLSGCSLLQPRVPPPHAASRALGRRRLLVASWAVQIMLGVLSGVLGGFLFIFYHTTLLGSGAPIWTGAVAVLAGAVAFIYEKRGGTYWALLRTLLALAAFSTATAAIIIGARSFHEYHHVFFHGICDVSPSWGPTRAPSSPSADVGRLQLCTSYVNILKVAGPGKSRQRAVGREGQTVESPVHKHQCHAVGGLGSTASGISGPPVSVLLEKIPVKGVVAQPRDPLSLTK
ncbi:hypothetical protein E2I00_013395 [Balaenoptera physalus]|uniref:Transmembrane protein 176A n=1 Tax=Balaenoptera physalus TaxID=9770 RepID=A0A643C6Y8_BALPH|nr:hypothetical protein E2I00_013395 [Balaenoptera physalus]